jgi:hypothetical protein
MNVFIVKQATQEVVARYEIHKIGDAEGPPPPETAYHDSAWRHAVRDGLVKDEDRAAYQFRVQQPKTLYESSV